MASDGADREHGGELARARAAANTIHHIASGLAIRCELLEAARDERLSLVETADLAAHAHDTSAALYAALDRLLTEANTPAPAEAVGEPDLRAAATRFTDEEIPEGKFVRDLWLSWARTQPNVEVDHPSWLLTWDELDEGQRHVDALIERAIRVDEREQSANLIYEVRSARRMLLNNPPSPERDEAVVLALSVGLGDSAAPVVLRDEAPR